MEPSTQRERQPTSQVDPALDAGIQRVVSLARATIVHADFTRSGSQQHHWEFEVRMKVSCAFFERVCAWFNAHCSTSPAHLSDDVFYTVTLRGAETTVRASRTVARGEDGQDVLQVSTVEKIRLADQAVRVTPESWGSQQQYRGGHHVQKGVDYCDMRVTLSRETLEGQEPKHAGVGMRPMTFMRRKVRQSFAFHKWWRLDATVVYTGNTLQELEEAQRHGVCEYELEIECIDLPAMLSEKTDAYVAQDAMLKCVALFTPSAYKLN
jgi:hypothetical protein